MDWYRMSECNGKEKGDKNKNGHLRSDLECAFERDQVAIAFRKMLI